MAASSKTSKARLPIVLVVDDEPHIAQVVALNLSRAGLTPICCANGAEALERARLHPPSLVITDHQMPKMTGLEFAQQLRAASRTPPVLMLTARGTGLDRSMLEQAGIVAVMAKPFSPRALVERSLALITGAVSSEAA
ncbi:MAG: response regulator [Planctomycetota bacterium]